MVGKTHRDLMSAEDAERLATLKRRVIATGQPVREEICLTIFGERHCYREAIDPLRDASGAIIGVIGAGADITGEMKTQEELKQTLMFRERMMGVLGHDLRNPLTSVSIASEQLRRRHELSPDARLQVERIQRATRRIASMVSTLFDFTQARFRGGLPIAPVATDLGEVARPVVDELRAARPAQALTLTVRGDARGEWDPVRLGEVISNLVANALNHGDPHQPVTVTIDGTARDEVALQVHNQGAPIPAELMPVIFEPFRRGAADMSPPGLGLGLFIVQQIVTAHAGTIHVESTRERGTLFEVHLPRRRLS
jgi:signal transduction histidine kinase